MKNRASFYLSSSFIQILAKCESERQMRVYLNDISVLIGVGGCAGINPTMTPLD